MFELKKDHIYIAKANIATLDKDNEKTGIFFNVSVFNLINSLEKLVNKEQVVDDSTIVEFKVLPLNHNSDKFTHSVKINIKHEDL